jgi:hypothetical protein
LKTILFVLAKQSGGSEEEQLVLAPESKLMKPIESTNIKIS